MKKILFFIIATLLFTISCIKFPDEKSIDFKAGPKVEITVLDNVKQMSVIYIRKDVAPFKDSLVIFKPNPDSMFCFKMKTTDAASFFSYLVTEEKEGIEASNVLRCTYPGVKETFQYGENNAATRTAKEIVIMVADNRYKPNIKEQEIDVVPAGNDTILMFTSLRFTTYQIYAASGHKDGGVGELSNSSVRKTDNKVRPLRSSSDDGIISISFTEAIKRGEGKVTGNYYYEMPRIELAGKIEIEEDDITVYDNILEISLSDKFPPGAHVCITWEKDVVQDLFGKSAEEYTVHGYSREWLGHYVRKPFKTWKLEGTEEKLIKFHDIPNFRILLSVDNPPVPPVYRNADFDVLVTYNFNDGKTTTIPLPNGNTTIVDGNITIRLPQTNLLEAKTFISILINENSYVDKFGNGNEKFEMKQKYQYVTQYIVSASAGEGGKIAPTGDRNVNVGADITFRITPDAGYRIDKVLIDGVNNPTAVTNGTYTFTNVLRDHTIAASFAKN